MMEHSPEFLEAVKQAVTENHIHCLNAPKADPLAFFPKQDEGRIEIGGSGTPGTYVDLDPWLQPHTVTVGGGPSDTGYVSAPDTWWAPAGVNRGETKEDIQKLSGYERVNIRRVLDEITDFIQLALLEAVFEPNDTAVRREFIKLVSEHLREWQAHGAINDFTVICDATNNPPSTVDNNELIVDIYVSPSKSPNYIQLNFVATNTGASFDEFTAQGGPVVDDDLIDDSEDDECWDDAFENLDIEFDSFYE
jgi:hypothetical protein